MQDLPKSYLGNYKEKIQAINDFLYQSIGADGFTGLALSDAILRNLDCIGRKLEHDRINTKASDPYYKQYMKNTSDMNNKIIALLKPLWPSDLNLKSPNESAFSINHFNQTLHTDSARLNLVLPISGTTTAYVPPNILRGLSNEEVTALRKQYENSRNYNRSGDFIGATTKAPELVAHMPKNFLVIFAGVSGATINEQKVAPLLHCAPASNNPAFEKRANLLLEEGFDI